MAELIHKKRVDDLAHLQGKEVEATETVRFGLDGMRYKIDLTAQNAERLRASLAEFVQAATPLSKSPTTSQSERDENQKIRDWARAQGIKISDRGRIPIEVLRAYAAGHLLSSEQAQQLELVN